MRKTFDPSILFEAWRRVTTAPYATIRASLDANRAGKKGMSMFGCTTADVLDGGDTYVEIVREASARGLVVVLETTPTSRRVPFERRDTRIFVARPEELWRVPAFLALWSTAFEDGAWSNAAEAQASLLLGYNDAQRKRWLDGIRFENAAWGCRTIYTLLSGDQRDRVLSVGTRCLGSADDVGGMHFFYAQHQVIKRDAWRSIPKDLTLARVGLAWDEAEQLFGRAQTRKRHGLVTATLRRARAAATNAALRSNVQLLTRRGWE